MNDTELRSHLHRTVNGFATSIPPLARIKEQAYARRRRNRQGVVALVDALGISEGTVKSHTSRDSACSKER